MKPDDTGTCAPDKSSRRNTFLKLVVVYVSILAFFYGAFIVPYGASKICQELYRYGFFDRFNLQTAMRVFYGVISAIAVIYVLVAVAVIGHVQRRVFEYLLRRDRTSLSSGSPS